MILPTFTTVLAKEMNRREFLIHIGLLLLVLTGISGLLRTLSNPNLLSTHKQVSSGFGSGAYGGARKV